jgi:hypothetical protein
MPKKADGPAIHKDLTEQSEHGAKQNPPSRVV